LAASSSYSIVFENWFTLSASKSKKQTRKHEKQPKARKEEPFVDVVFVFSVCFVFS